MIRSSAPQPALNCKSPTKSSQNSLSMEFVNQLNGDYANEKQGKLRLESKIVEINPGNYHS